MQTVVFNYIGNGVRLLVKAILLLWPPATVCLLQRRTALHLAAVYGHVAVVKTLLLNGAYPGATNCYVSYSSCIASLAPHTSLVTM